MPVDQTPKIIAIIDDDEAMQDSLRDLLQGAGHWSRLHRPIRLSSSGGTGTGKELIAHAIHNASQRSGRVFIKIKLNLRCHSSGSFEKRIIPSREGRLGYLAAAA